MACVLLICLQQTSTAIYEGGGRRPRVVLDDSSNHGMWQSAKKVSSCVKPLVTVQDIRKGSPPVPQDDTANGVGNSADLNVPGSVECKGRGRRKR